MNTTLVKATAVSLMLVPAAMSALARDNDPTVITVGKEKVPVSEFNYLYHKNNAQQLAPMTPEEYAELFAVYKMKVAEAREAGLDTTRTFNEEYKRYRHSLLEPYLRDSVTENDLVNDAYSHFFSDRDVSHIMIPDDARGRELIDSIRTLIADTADFARMARLYSIDKGSGPEGGHLGWLPRGRLPYSFEKAAYDTPVGSVSEVVRTPFGLHLILVNAEKKQGGQINARHILKLTQGKDEAGIAEARRAIDSLYLVAMTPGADFADIARRESEDPGSASKGGQLPWFGRGMMVPEFENTAFNMTDGEISKPFATSYGYHIIQRLGHRDAAPLSELRPKLIEAMKRDDRYALPGKVRMDALRNKYGFSTDTVAISALRTRIADAGAIDSALVAVMTADITPLGHVGAYTVTVADLFAGVSPSDGKITRNEAGKFVDSKLEEALAEATEEALASDLTATDPDMRNLLKEYYEGMLLFEAANRQVWGKAATDTDALNDYFNANRANYTWESPKYKGYLVYASSDSVASEVNNWLNTAKPSLEELTEALTDKYQRRVRVEKVLAGKGENPTVDAVVFDNTVPPRRGPWRFVALYQGKLIDAPEEMNDVRGAVTVDYQNVLEKEWETAMKRKYPVKINKKVLKSVE